MSRTNEPRVSLDEAERRIRATWPEGDVTRDWTVSPQFSLLEAISLARGLDSDIKDFIQRAGLTHEEQIAVLVDGDISVSASAKIAAAVGGGKRFWRNLSRRYMAERKRLGKDE